MTSTPFAFIDSIKDLYKRWPAGVVWPSADGTNHNDTNLHGGDMLAEPNPTLDPMSTLYEPVTEHADDDDLLFADDEVPA